MAYRNLRFFADFVFAFAGMGCGLFLCPSSSFKSVHWFQLRRPNMPSVEGAHLNPSAWEAEAERQADLCEFKASLVYKGDTG